MDERNEIEQPELEEDLLLKHDHGREVLTREEALAYMGVNSAQFDALMKSFGIGRYHLPERDDQVFYAKKDLDHVRTQAPAAKTT